MTDTATAPASTDAAARALQVEKAIAAGYDTQKQLIDQTGIAKTTLLATLNFLTEGRRVEKVQDGRNVFYRVASQHDRISGPPPTAIADAIKRNAAAKAAGITPEQRAAHVASAAAAADIAAAPLRLPPAATPAPPAAPRARMPKGHAEALILAYLADHMGQAYGPYELGRALAPVGHKPLGVRDACARLAARGQIIATQDSPVRYQHRMNTPPTQEA